MGAAGQCWLGWLRGIRADSVLHGVNFAISNHLRGQACLKHEVQSPMAGVATAPGFTTPGLMAENPKFSTVRTLFLLPATATTAGRTPPGQGPGPWGSGTSLAPTLSTCFQKQSPGAGEYWRGSPVAERGGS